MKMAIEYPQNYGPWQYYVVTCTNWAYCSGEAAENCTASNIPVGAVKVYQILQCQALGYQYPLAHNYTSVPILIDPKGNKYAMHALCSDYPNCTVPVSPAPGWTVDYLEMGPGDAPLIVQPQRMNDTCTLNFDDREESGCFHTLAQDANGTAYHRFFYSGEEPDGVAISSALPCKP